MPNAAADGIAAAASTPPSSKRASALKEPSRAKVTTVDAASLDLDAFLNGGFLSVVPTPQGKGGIGLNGAKNGAAAAADGSKPRRSSKTQALSP